MTTAAKSVIPTTATILLRQLLNVTELNMDDMEPGTCALVNQVHEFLIAKRLADNSLRTAVQALVNDLREMDIDDPDEPLNGSDTVDVVCQHYPSLVAALAL